MYPNSTRGAVDFLVGVSCTARRAWGAERATRARSTHRSTGATAAIRGSPAHPSDCSRCARSGRTSAGADTRCSACACDAHPPKPAVVLTAPAPGRPASLKVCVAVATGVPLVAATPALSIAASTICARGVIPSGSLHATIPNKAIQ